MSDFGTIYGINLISIAFDVIVLIIAITLGWYIGKWAKNRKHVERVGTTFSNLDPKTGYAKTYPVPPYNELPASIRFEDEKARVNRRNTKGYPTFTVDFTDIGSSGGIERMYVCSSDSKTCVTSEQLCGHIQEDTDMTFMTSHDESLWAEAGTEMEHQPPKIRQILWQLVLAGLAGFALGVFIVAFAQSRAHPATNSTATQAAIQMVRIAIAR